MNKKTHEVRKPQAKPYSTREPNCSIPVKTKPGRGSAAQCNRDISSETPGGRTCGTPLWVSTTKEHFLPIYGLFCQPTKRGALVFFCLFQLLDLTSPPQQGQPQDCRLGAAAPGETFQNHSIDTIHLCVLRNQSHHGEYAERLQSLPNIPTHKETELCYQPTVDKLRSALRREQRLFLPVAPDSPPASHW